MRRERGLQLRSLNQIEAPERQTRERHPSEEHDSIPHRSSLSQWRGVDKKAQQHREEKYGQRSDGRVSDGGGCSGRKYEHDRSRPRLCQAYSLLHYRHDDCSEQSHNLRIRKFHELRRRRSRGIVLTTCSPLNPANSASDQSWEMR